MKEQKRREMCRRVMRLAAHFLTASFCWREAMSAAWHCEKLHNDLQNGIVEFDFQKIDGTRRHAVGTCCAALIPTTGGARKSNPLVQVFYDVEKQAFRSFRKDLLI